MTTKELQKMSRTELVELLHRQQTVIERLERELDQAKQELEDKRIIAKKAGSLAEASLALTNVFTEAQKAAELYLYNVRRAVDERYGKQ